MDNTFKTNDISLTAFLLAKGVDFIEITNEIGSQFSFVLSDPVKCEKLRKEYLNNASAPVQTLFSKREMLISEIKNKNNFDSRRGRSVSVSDD